jgi:amidase
MPLFGQDTFEKAVAMPGLDDAGYQAARATSLRLAGADGLDRMLAGVDALVAPTAPPAWFIDPVNADQAPFGGAGGLAAVAGHPHLTVPMGAVRGLPVGLSFIGPRWAEARLLALGYSFEQAGPPLAPVASLRQTVEEQAEVARLLAPATR